MEYLGKLIPIIHTQKIKGFHLFQSDDNGISKMEQLYNYIKENERPTDQNAMKLLNYSDKQVRAYRMLKKRLKERLLNTMLLLDADGEEFTDLAKEYFAVSRLWTIGHLLINRNSRELAVPLFNEAYKKAAKFEFTKYAYLIANELRKHYAFISPDNKSFEFYSEAAIKLQKTLIGEMLAERYYDDLSNLYVTQRSKLKKIKKIADEYAQELTPMQEEITSYKFNLKAFGIASFNYTLQNKFEEAIEVSKKAIAFYKKKQFNNKNAIFSNQKDITSNYIKLNNYEEAKKYIIQNMSLQKEGTFNWFSNMTYYFIVSSFQKDNEKLFEITSRVTQNKSFREYKTHYQAWRIKEAYIHFLIGAGKIKDPNAYPLRPFRLGRFLNEVPEFAQDKRGFNISILIVQILFYILNRNFNQITSRLDALNQYCHRYLKNDETLRSNCFIKMLLKLPDARYHPLRVERYVDKYYKRLTETPIDISEQGVEVEIIPYERLWEIVMELLAKNR